MFPQILIVIVFIIDFIINLYADRKRKETLKVLTKPLLVPLIILFYLTSAEDINWFIVTALFFGFLGDVSLLWGSKRIFFAIGLFSFLVGHLLYILAFLQSIPHFEVIPIWFLIFLIPYILYGCALLRILRPNLNKMIVPVSIYMSIILMMSFTSLCCIWNGFTLQFILPFIGSLLFIVSDTVLAYNNFNAPLKNYETLIMGTYIFAQVLIVAGFLY
ncbi:lysoplasmalogenase [Desulfosporosinus sp. OT]|uniref:lysoplasmalogenase n=1 Tax=Desulfosporosinus sp. OT TaxID=913865 RepID=UPI000223A6D0|nr:lysoplasmalogenase [Desulfosporosinus sp. OT]EGW41911.1 yhhN-like family protein [Desulfosporosinus sp. OT]